MISFFLIFSLSETNNIELSGVSPWMIGSNNERKVLIQYSPIDASSLDLLLNEKPLSCDDLSRGFVNCTVPALSMGIYTIKLQNTENTIKLIVVNWTVVILVVALIFGAVGIASSVISYITCMLSRNKKTDTDDEPFIPKTNTNKGAQMRNGRNTV